MVQRHFDQSIYIAPELAIGFSFSSFAVDVFSFAIIAAQVMDGFSLSCYEKFESDYRLSSRILHTLHEPRCIFHCVLTSYCDEMTNKEIINAVKQGLRPDISQCSCEMRQLISRCWESKPSSRPCLSLSLPFLNLWQMLVIHVL